MGKADRFSGIFWLLVSVVISVESYDLGLGGLRKPGPGFFFFWTGIVLGLMSLTIIIRSLTDKDSSQGKRLFPKELDLKKVVLVPIALFLYAASMESVGFLLITFVFFCFMLGVVEKKGWSFTLTVALAVTFGSYLIFQVLLKSQLPRGVLEFLRF